MLPLLIALARARASARRVAGLQVHLFVTLTRCGYSGKLGIKSQMLLLSPQPPKLNYPEGEKFLGI
jgi:hypothetical protein